MLLRLRQNTNAFWIHAVSLNMKVSRLPTYQLVQTVVSTLKNSKTLSNPPQLLHQWWQWTTKLVSFSQSKNWAKFAERTKSFSTRMQLKLLAKFLWMSTIWKLTSCPSVAIRCMVQKVCPVLFWNYKTFLLIKFHFKTRSRRTLRKKTSKSTIGTYSIWRWSRKRTSIRNRSDSSCGWAWRSLFHCKTGNGLWQVNSDPIICLKDNLWSSQNDQSFSDNTSKG